MKVLPRISACLSFMTLGALAAIPGCAPESPDLYGEPDGEEPTDRGDAITSGSVSDAVAKSCSTSSVKALSQQIIDEAACMEPAAFVALPSLPNLTINDGVFGYLEAPARDALVAALKANPSKQLNVTSMLRTVAQQYMLYRWYQNGSCGIGLAAKPGASNHETGLALDTPDYSTWRTALENKGFDWLGTSDKPHFDYAGTGAKSYKGMDVKAFQRLWNRNHPEDKISEDGSYGPQTEARLKKSPIEGFAKGPSCQVDPGPTDPVEPDPGTTACTGTSEFKCSADGNTRTRCSAGKVVAETCARGCLISSGDDVCMSTSAAWSCSGSYGTTKAANGDYYGTAFGCWVDSNGVEHGDPGDNCIPGCLAKAQSNGLCAGLSGPDCEREVNWYAADAGRFGCLARLRVTNPKNGKAVIVAALDYGPACWVEAKVSKAAIDLSYPAATYLFGGEVGIADKALTHVVEVDPSTPLGPVK